MEAAALKIQAVHRGKKTRMELFKEKQEKEGAHRGGTQDPGCAPWAKDPHGTSQGETGEG